MEDKTFYDSKKVNEGISVTTDTLMGMGLNLLEFWHVAHSLEVAVANEIALGASDDETVIGILRDS